MVASKQIAENYVETGRKKAELPVSHMLILGFFAGMFIALAGAGASVASAAMTNASASRIASALVFPAGLALVVCTGAELFTGNCLMMISALQKRISVGGLFKNLLFVYLGNLIGAIFVAILFVYGHIPSLYGGDLAQVLLNTAVAVWAAMSSEQVSGKILALYPPVAIFILCGFEHCIANMFYIPAGLMIMGEYGLAAEGLTIGTFILNNLIPATIGNMIGGMLVIGGGYWLVYLRGTKNREIK